MKRGGIEHTPFLNKSASIAKNEDDAHAAVAYLRHHNSVTNAPNTMIFSHVLELYQVNNILKFQTC